MREDVTNLWLVRHGLLNEDLYLSQEGLRFAQKLPDLIGCKHIDQIISDESTRCQQTVQPLAESCNVEMTTHSKDSFSDPPSFFERITGCNVVICYRIESINPLLAHLGLEQYNDQTRNSAYSEIIRLEKRNEGWVSTRIPTGYQRSHPAS